jgi:hypothetical protein
LKELPRGSICSSRIPLSRAYVLSASVGIQSESSCERVRLGRGPLTSLLTGDGEGEGEGEGRACPIVAGSLVRSFNGRSTVVRLRRASADAKPPARPAAETLAASVISNSTRRCFQPSLNNDFSNGLCVVHSSAFIRQICASCASSFGSPPCRQ